jgi:peptidoglycan/LPS O-acetylase OafA/YrhL
VTGRTGNDPVTVRSSLSGAHLKSDMNESTNSGAGRPGDWQPLVTSHMPELDVIRGMAVLLVLHCHILAEYPRGFGVEREGAVNAVLRLAIATASPMGWLGVQLFFVLSGFLITGILLESRTRSDYYSRFYARRAVRILPPYLLIVFGLVALGKFGWGFPDWTIGQILCCLGFAANMMPLFGLTTPYGPLWSLAVEEHFYLVWPALVRNSSAALGWICALICVLGVCLRGISRAVDPLYDLSSMTWFNLDGLVVGALAGILLGRYQECRGRVVWLALAFLLGSVLLFIGLSCVHQLARSTYFGGVLGPVAWSSLFASLLLFAVLLRSRWPGIWGRRSPVVVLCWLGFISYGLYLFHVVAMQVSDHFLGGVLYPADLARHSPQEVLVRYAAVAGLATLSAFFSRVTLERYFLSRKAQAERLFSHWFGRKSPVRH